MHEHTLAHSYIHMHAHTYACTHVRYHASSLTRSLARSHTRSLARTYAYTHARMHACTYAHAHAHLTHNICVSYFMKMLCISHRHWCLCMPTFLHLREIIAYSGTLFRLLNYRPSIQHRGILSARSHRHLTPQGVYFHYI